MPTVDDYVQVSKGGVSVAYAQESATPGTPDTYDLIGCPKGDWQIGDTIEAVEDNISNWCNAIAEAALRTAAIGDETLTVGGTLELILDDAAYLAMEADKGVAEGYLKISATDNDGANTKEWEYRVFCTQFNTRFPEQGTSDVAVQFRVNAVKPAGGWGS